MVPHSGLKLKFADSIYSYSWHIISAGLGRNMTKRVNIILSVVLLVLTLVWAVRGVQRISAEGVTFDDAYNAQVAANFAENGFYGVSYPDNIPYYCKITTGPTMLLPTALLYKLGGKSIMMTGLVPLLYAIGCFVVLFFIGMVCMADRPVNRSFFEGREIKADYLGVLSAIICMFTAGWMVYLSHFLLGEIAALFFVLLAMLFFIKFADTGSNISILLAGAAVGLSFVTKESQIFMSLVFFAIGAIEWIWFRKEFKGRQFASYAGGFVAGFGIFEIFKLVTLGSFSAYISWWKDEKANIFDQTGSSSFFDRFSIEEIGTRFNYLKEVFNMPAVLAAVMIIIPLVMFLIMLIKRDSHAYSVRIITEFAVAADSLLVYFVLFGASGLAYARRMAVYAQLLSICLVLLFIRLIFYMVNINDANSEKGYDAKRYVIAVVPVLIFIVANFSNIDSNVKALLRTPEKTVTADANEAMSDYVSSLPEEAVLYGFDWYQAPEISLMSNRVFKDITREEDFAKIDFDNSYLVVSYQINPPYGYEGDFDSFINSVFKTEVEYHDERFEGRYVVYKLVGVN